MEQNKKPSIFNRKYFVSGFQYRMMYGNMLYLLGAIFVFLIVIFGPVILKMGDTTIAQEQREIAARQLLVLHERVWIALPIIIGLCAIYSVMTSHRIAGPLYRFKQLLRTMGTGDLTMRVRIRSSDYLHDEAQTLSDTIENLANRIANIERSYKQAARTMPRLASVVGQDGSREAAVIAGQLATQLDALGDRIGQFRIPETEEEPLPFETRRIPVAAGR